MQRLRQRRRKPLIDAWKNSGSWSTRVDSQASSYMKHFPGEPFAVNSNESFDATGSIFGFDNVVQID